MPRKRLSHATLFGLLVIAGAASVGTPSAGAPKESIIYNFDGADGSAPYSGVIADATGTLYGVTIGGHVNGNAFSLTPSHKGYTFTNLYDFCSQANCTDGDRPAGLIRDKKGNLYGFAFAGGNVNGCGGYGCGVVYELKPGKSGYKETVLYTFTGGADGGNPISVPVMQKDGTILGVANDGGDCQNCGTVFSLTPNGSGYTETTLFQFNGGSTGALPSGIVVDKNGTIFGTTSFGGSYDGGIIFALTQNNGTYTETILHEFEGGSDGAEPDSAPVIDEKSGAILGTAESGTTSYCGVVWMLTPKGSGYTETTLYNFQGNGDGCAPEGPVLISGKSIYGTTLDGPDKRGPGSVFELKRQGSRYALKVLHNFTGPPNDGSLPYTAPLILSGGALFGTTYAGGNGCSGYGCGTVFRVVP